MLVTGTPELILAVETFEGSKLGNCINLVVLNATKRAIMTTERRWILTHTSPQIPGCQNFDRQVRIDLANDLNGVAIREVGILNNQS
jgi:hypothetical protein